VVPSVRVVTVFVLQVAAQPHSGGSGHDSDGSSSGASLSEQQQLHSRPMRGAQGSMDAALSQQQVRMPL
jgi:hypothetical protein